jgi:hypothetical protein
MSNFISHPKGKTKFEGVDEQVMRTFGPKRGDRKLCNEEFQHFYSRNMGVIKTRIGWIVYMECTGDEKCIQNFDQKT